MSVYNDLNDLKLDLGQYDEEELTSLQKRGWENRVLGKIRKQGRKSGRSMTVLVASVIASAGILLSSGIYSFADVPFVGALIDDFIPRGETADYTPYKKAIGESAENAFGKWTVNEVMVDNGWLYISSTFEPAKGVKFNYQMHPRPKIRMNGEEIVSGGLQQSIKVNDVMYTIYNRIELPNLPAGKMAQFHLEFDNLDSTFLSEGVPVDQPWVFDIEISTEQLVAASKTIYFNRDLLLGSGQSVHLEKLVSSPISTVLYFDVPEGNSSISFQIVSEKGKVVLPNEVSTSNEESYSRYPSIDLKSEKYYLVPYEGLGTPDSSFFFEELRIPINP